MKKTEEIIIYKIRNYAAQAVDFINGYDFIKFSNDAKTILACVFNLTQIGELVSRLSKEFIEKNNMIPWRKIKGLRNKIVHDYEGIQLNIVWNVLETFLPELIQSLDKMIND